jgi:hypothetical protein
MSNSGASAADPINDSKPSYSGGNHLSVHRVVKAMLLLGGAAAFIGLLLYNSAYPFRFLPGSYHGASESLFPVSSSSLLPLRLPNIIRFKFIFFGYLYF